MGKRWYQNVSSSDDIIDSRDVESRIDELENDLDTDRNGNVLDTEFNETSLDELKILKSLRSEGEQYSDWKEGATLIRDSYFKEYAQQFADDIGAIDANAAWPLNHIDWDAAADELQMDYTSLDFDGVEYWMR